MLERDDLKTRLIAAERTSVAAMDEVAALRGEINELKDALSEEYQAKVSTGVRVKVMNFQKKHENLLYPLGCYYYCPKSH